ncbi:MAG TPA: HAD family hydrolase [Microlunatus sp.]|nr:HAD family hydrolase [Microlunatus sp.]
MSELPLPGADPVPPRSGRRPRLIVTDLDGTFLSPDGTVSDLNAAAVKAAQAADVPVVFATGRPVRWLEVIADLPGAHPIVIASNGAVLFDQGTGRTLRRLSLDPDVVRNAISSIRNAFPEAALALESGTHFGHEAHYVTLPASARSMSAAADRGVSVVDVAELAAEGGHVKLLVQHPTLRSEELLERVRPLLGDRLLATHSGFTRPDLGEAGLLEISAGGVSKATMLAYCCEGLGVAAEDVAGFGDMPNDVDMLSWVGMPHLVANAHPSLHGRYPMVPSNADSGVGRTILGWLE